MCGIVGYTGPHQASPILVSGLRRLEYRGYDSSGLAAHEGGTARGAVACRPGRACWRRCLSGSRSRSVRDQPDALGHPRAGDRH